MAANIQSILVITILASTLAAELTGAAFHRGDETVVAIKSDRLPIAFDPHTGYLTLERHLPGSSVLCRVPIGMGIEKLRPACG